MTAPAVRVLGLSKRYSLGSIDGGYRTFREAIVARLRRPWLHRTRDAAKDDSVWALKDVTFDVPAGDVVGIIGRNGAGKSTLLKILAGTTEPTCGRAELRGRVGSLLEIGTGFHPELTGRENIFLSGAILGMKQDEIRKKFDQIVAFAETERFLDTPVKRYSSGMYLRLAFAVAAHLEPEILVVDEVLAVGDTAFQKKCLGKMGDVSRQGRTVLLVSHNMVAVRQLCSRAVLLSRGQIQALGPADEVIQEYLRTGAAGLETSVPLPAPAADALGAATYVRFLAVDGAPRAEFRVCEPWRIALHFEMNRAAPEVIAAVGLITMDSLPIVTYWSKPKDLSAGRYTVVFECDLPIAASDVQFTCGLSSRGMAFHSVVGVGRVSIMEVASGEQPLHATANYGIIASLQKAEIVPRSS